jgi:hypothetical protein
MIVETLEARVSGIFLSSAKLQLAQTNSSVKLQLAHLIREAVRKLKLGATEVKNALRRTAT